MVTMDEKSEQGSELLDTIVGFLTIPLVAFFLLFVLPFLVGCQAPLGTRDLLPQEQDIVIETIDAWDRIADHSDSVPVSDNCYQQLMEIGVYVAYTHEEMLEITGHCGPDANRPDFNPETEEVFDSGRACPADADLIWGQARYGYVDRYRVVVIANTTDWCKTFPHEVLHHLMGCMFGDSDPGHTSSTWEDLHVAPGSFQRSQGPDEPNWPGCTPILP